MKLYRINQTVNNGYDTYSEAVVAARNEQDAVTIHPDGSDEPVTNSPREWDAWAAVNDVEWQYLGEAHSGLARGVIVASFHAG